MATASKDIANIFKDFYTHLYTPDNPPKGTITDFLNKHSYTQKLSEDHKHFLDQPVTPEEVSETIKSLKNNKTPETAC